MSPSPDGDVSIRVQSSPLPPPKAQAVVPVLLSDPCLPAVSLAANVTLDVC